MPAKVDGAALVRVLGSEEGLEAASLSQSVRLRSFSYVLLLLWVLE